MLIVIKKKIGTNQWHYPDSPQLFTSQFINPDNPDELVAVNDSGKTIIELSDSAGYVIAEYLGTTPKSNLVKKVGMGELGELLPAAVLIELEDYSRLSATAQPKREAAVRVLTRINSNYSVDVLHADFVALIWQLETHTTLTEDERDNILNTLQSI